MICEKKNIDSYSVDLKYKLLSMFKKQYFNFRFLKKANDIQQKKKIKAVKRKIALILTSYSNAFFKTRKIVNV